MRAVIVALTLNLTFIAAAAAKPQLQSSPQEQTPQAEAPRKQPGPAAPDSREQQAQQQEAPVVALRVFLDCDDDCDFDYLRREVMFVNYVRDRQDAEVHVLVTTRDSGGGEEWTVAFIGLEQYEGRDVTLVYNSSDTDTEDEVRAGFAQVFRIGLLNYMVGHPLLGRIGISYEELEAAEAQAAAMAQSQDDPWNFWIFRASLDAEFEGEQRTSEKSFSGSFSANRTTEAWKIRSEIEGRFSEEEFELNDGSLLVSDSRNYQVFGQVVKTLGEHWGASIRGAADASTFDNQNLAISAAPGIEYNVFPYSESSRRALTFTYEIGFSSVDYEEETIFEVTSETLFDHLLLLNYDVNQPWGESNFSVELSQFLDHPSQYRAEVGGRLEFRVIRGLSLEVDGEFSWVRDQRFIPKEDITDEEVLLRRRALATDFNYELSIGFSYTFGSIFNNVVNPRFSGRRGGGGGNGDGFF
ncbi:MAG TPA: hypothetical protein VGD06_16660 [Acidobacteriota bacterium]